MSSNSDQQALERRLAAVERAIDGSTQETPATPADREAVEDRLADLEQRVDELDAALQAVRGFLGGVDAVNEGVEAQADSAIAAVDRLERRLDRAGLERDNGEPDDHPDNQGNSSVEEGEHLEGNEEQEPPKRDRVPDVQTTADNQESTLRNRLSGQW